MIEHSNDLAGLVAHDLLLLLIVQRWYCESTGILWLDVKVDVAEMSEVAVQWIRSYVVARLILVLC